MKTNETLAQGIDAVATSDLPGLWLEGTSVPKWGLGLFFVFLLLNALFVAYRQAILRVKVAADLQEDEQSEAAADKIVDKIGDRTEYHLQVAQVGITLCSLALGYFAAPFFAHFLHGLLLNSGLDMPVRLLKAIALGFSFLLVAFFLLLLGEFIPKTVGIRAPLSVAKFFGLPLQAISYPLRPFVWLAEGSSNFVLRHFLRMEPAVESELAHSAEELGEIISEAEESDEVTETERKILLNALELNDLLVRDVMTPRGSVLTLDIDDSFEQNLQVAVESNYSRLPLVTTRSSFGYFFE